MKILNLDKGVETWILASLVEEDLNLAQAKAKCSDILAAAVSRAQAKIDTETANPPKPWPSQRVQIEAIKAAEADIKAWAKDQ